VWVSGPFGQFGQRPISNNPFALSDHLFALERLPRLISTGEVVLSPLTMESIVLPLPSITGTTVDLSGKES
jgi:hypothetical protein